MAVSVLQIKNGNYLDAALWARVESWDPDRVLGARSKRTEEYHADDVSPGVELLAAATGAYHPPVRDDGQCSIALAWPTRRTITVAEVEFDNERGAPDADGIRPEFWEGDSGWQGQWTPLKGNLKQTGPAIWRFEVEGHGQATQKIRWVLSGVDSSISVLALRALTPSPMTTADLAILAEDQPPGSCAEVRIVNGAMADGNDWVSSCQWDLASTLTLVVRCAKPTGDTYAKADRTLLQFSLPGESFAIAVEDVLQRGPVYLPRLGIFASKTPVEESLEERKRAIASRRTILQEVAAMPEQTRKQAMAKTHYSPWPDSTPMMLSLACGNDKFIVARNGSLAYHENFVTVIMKEGEWPRALPPIYNLTPRYGNRRIASATQNWGQLGIDVSAYGGDSQPLPLRIGERTYAKGVGHYVNGEIVIALDGEYERFECETGVQYTDTVASDSVSFRVGVDGQTMFDSGQMRTGDAARSVSVPLAGARSLRLVTAGSGDVLMPSVMANWADARLLRRGQTEPEYVGDIFRNEPSIERKLEGGWLPSPVSTAVAGGVRYSQQTYVAPLGGSDAPYGIGGKALGIVELTVENLRSEAAKASVRFDFSPGDSTQGAIAVSDGKSRSTVCVGDRLIAIIDSGEFGPGSAEAKVSSWLWTADLPANFRGRLFVYLPTWQMSAAQERELSGASDLFPRFERYWNEILSGATQVQTPDDWLNNVIRANLVHIYIAARNEENGARIVPWIASQSYPHAIDSEGNSVIRGMLQFGNFDFARRAFEFYFSRYTPEGFMTTGYTLHGTGWHLRTLAEYVRLSQNHDWFCQHADYPVKMCRWVMAQREKTKKTRPNGERVVDYGLMPPGTVADWPIFLHYFYGEGQYCAGLKGMADAMRDLNRPEAAEFADSAAEYRREIERTFAYAESQAPAAPLRNGAWVPFHPLAVDVPGRVDEMFRSMRDAYVTNWLYDVELGAQQLAVFGLMDPNDPRIGDMLNDMEDNQFLRDGAGAYPATMNRVDWFNFGGFAKAQPYYAEIPELYALRDEVKPFLRSYFNSVAALINKEVLSIHEGVAPFCFNKTHETGYFLGQTRDMLLAERDEDLWLAPLTPCEWLKDGKQIEVKNAPTKFGLVSYRIKSSISSGRIEAEIEPPTRSMPKAIVLRLRHPEGKPIRSVEVEGGGAAMIDNEGETIRFEMLAGKISLTALYG